MKLAGSMVVRAFGAVVLCIVIAFGAAVPPANAQQQSTSKAQKPAAQKPAPKGAALPDDGSVADGVYAEKFFNLRYAVPQGWVVRTPEMRQGLAQPESAVLLLSTAEKSAPAPGEINPSVTITAEGLSLYPQVKTAADYFDSLAELVNSKGFTTLNEPAEIEVGGVTFLRGDFQKQEGEQVTYQATMVALRKGYILQITAISGNEEQLTPLLNRVQIFAPPTMRKE